MTRKERILTAAAFKEADRVPIELAIGEKEKELPICQKIARFIEEQADNFIHIGGVDWGFFGLAGESWQEVIEDRPGLYQRIKRIFRSPVGEFFAITRHFYPDLDNPDFHWEKRHISSLSDLERLTEAERKPCLISLNDYLAGVEQVGESGVPMLGRLHPLGSLVRNATMEEVYGWLISERSLIHRFLERTNQQVGQTIEQLGRQGISGWFITYAHEMFIPPWLGRRHFEEFVLPYDQQVNEVIHRFGGKVRAHCHGRCMNFLTLMAQMGIDSIEPLEPPPWGDVDLKEAKRLVGDRMLLSGNIPCQNFWRMSQEDVRESVKKAIAEAGAGGGLTLRTTGGQAGVSAYLEPEMLTKIVGNVEAYIQAGLKYGQYPIKC
ncbi:MAG: hypothetical protein NC911_05540 [Candidatus Omnitrophica bacterium]|nr:hypothetical protein [Candidatus Omnitrophota bacterium]MCM8769122.1 hypothetical protein [Candidatus Omnitrophota bacterium]